MRVMRTIVMTAVLVVGALAGEAAAQRPTAADELFAPGTIRELRVTMSERDWATLRENFQLNTYYTADLRVMLGSGETVVRNVGVRSRGSGSRSGVKPALKIDIGRYVSGQRVFGLRTLILRNLLQDVSMLHEHVTMELQRRMGLPAPRTVFARFFVNQQYAGLYEIMEDVDEEFLDRVAGEHDGYLYEFAWLYPYYFQYLGPGLDAYEALWEPGTRTREPASSLFGPIEEMTRAISAGRDGDFANEVGRHLDIREVLRLAAADNFMAEWDGLLGYAGMNNIYLYRPVNGPALIVPWDKDNTFHALDYSAFSGTEDNVLVARAMRDPELRSVYVEALRTAASLSREPVLVPALQPGGTSETLGWMEALVETAARLIRKSAWSDPVKGYTKEAFEAAVTEARRFARLRSAIVDAEVAAATANR